jgi:hypothetical protein
MKHKNCQQCGAGLLHELIRIRFEVEASGQWDLCSSCASAALQRFERAHAEAEALLEEAWRL